MQGRLTHVFQRPLPNHRLAEWLDRYAVSDTGVLVAMALVVGPGTGLGALSLKAH